MPGGQSANFWGQLIRSLREESKMSQRFVATQTGVNRATLRRIEEGTARNDIEIIEKILDFFDYEIDAISKIPFDGKCSYIDTDKSKDAVQAILDANLYA